MRSVARSILVLVALSSLGAAEARGQTYVSVGLDTGPLFTGVSFGYGGHYETGSVFVGSAFGAAHPDYRGDYGIYSGSAHYASTGSCWDAYWNSYYDPYGGWYDRCVVAGPYRNSYRARSWGFRWNHYYGPRYRSFYAHVSDPYVSPWGPYWAYDPWGDYWNGYWDGYYDGSYWGGYGSYVYSPRHRTVYAYGSRSRVATVYRASPLYRGVATRRAGPGYKESPRGVTGRTAQRRSASASPAAAPSRTAVAATAKERTNGVASVNRRAPRVGPTTTPARTARPSAGARAGGRTTTPATRSADPRAGTRPSDRATVGDGARRVPTVGRTPVSVGRTTRGGPASRPSAALPRRTPTDRVRDGASSARPSRAVRPGNAATGRAVPRAGSAPRVAPNRPSAARGGNDRIRTTPPGARAPRPTGRPSARPAPSRTNVPTPRARTAPTRRGTSSTAPRARSAPTRSGAAPSRAPRARSAPSRGPGASPARRPAARSAPRAGSSRPPAARPAPRSSGRRPAATPSRSGPRPSGAKRRPARRPGGTG